MNILIVEDSSVEIKRLIRLVSEVAPDADLFPYTDSLDAQKDISLHAINPDVAFLDIEMPSPSGIELAELLKKEYPQVNIIFTTAYTAYMHKAFDLFVSGYLLKPFSAEDIQVQLSNLRYPAKEKMNVYFAKTIGEFDFFYNGKPISFSLARAKEALAYLIDRHGASVTKRELFSILFEDEQYSLGKQDHMKKIIRSLKATLHQIGGDDLLIHTRNSYAINMAMLETDMPLPEKRKKTAYMEQYSWADGYRS